MRATIRSAFFLMVPLAVLLWGGTAWSYVRTKTEGGIAMRWTNTNLKLLLYTAEPPDPLNKEVFERAAAAAASVWSAPAVACTRMNLGVTSVDKASADVVADRVNRVTFRRTSWCREPNMNEPCYDSSALAITSVFARSSDGVIVDADVEINAVNFSWTDLVTDNGNNPSAQDLQNTLAHEFGHVLGFDHTCLLAGGTGVDHAGTEIPICSMASSDIRATTMFAAVVRGDISRRDLAPDDIAAVCDVYPPGGGDEGGGCGTIATGRPARLSPWSLALVGFPLLVSWLLRVRRQRGV